MLPWIQALKAGLVEAACVGMAIHALAASEEDLASLAVQLSEGKDAPVPLLTLAATSCLDADESRQCEPGSRDTSLAAMLVLEHCARYAREQAWNCSKHIIPCCVSLMGRGDDNLALLAAHTFAHQVEAEGEDSVIFLEEYESGPALLRVLERECCRCKKAAVLAMNVLLKHVPRRFVIPALFGLRWKWGEVVPGSDGEGEDFARALMDAVCVRQQPPERLTRGVSQPFPWDASPPFVGEGIQSSLHPMALQVLVEAARVELAAHVLAAEGAGSVLRLQLTSRGFPITELLDAYVLLVKNTTAMPAEQRKDLMQLDNPQWLLDLMGRKRVKGRALWAFTELAEEGFVIDEQTSERPVREIMALLEEGDPDLLKPAALAMAALLRLQPKASGILLTSSCCQNAVCIAVSLVSKPGRGVKARAAGAIALNALLQADAAWAGLVLKERPATDTHGGIVADLVELLQDVERAAVVEGLQQFHVRTRTSAVSPPVISPGKEPLMAVSPLTTCLMVVWTCLMSSATEHGCQLVSMESRGVLGSGWSDKGMRLGICGKALQDWMDKFVPKGVWF